VQQAVWHNGGCASSESATKQQIKWLVASAGSPPLRQAAGRYLSFWETPYHEEQNLLKNKNKKYQFGKKLYLCIY
jgi:hypothetical protein